MTDVTNSRKQTVQSPSVDVTAVIASVSENEQLLAKTIRLEHLTVRPQVIFRTNLYE